MIAHRSRGREVFENAVRYRVAACRKRLRISRTSPRAQIHIKLDERLRELDHFSTPVRESEGPVRAGKQGEAESA